MGTAMVAPIYFTLLNMSFSYFRFMPIFSGSLLCSCVVMMPDAFVCHLVSVVTVVLDVNDDDDDDVCITQLMK